MGGRAACEWIRLEQQPSAGRPGQFHDAQEEELMPQLVVLWSQQSFFYARQQLTLTERCLQDRLQPSKEVGLGPKQALSPRSRRPLLHWIQ